MGMDTILFIVVGIIIVLVEALITGFGIALVIVGKKLRRYNSITDVAEFNLSKFSERNLHYIENRDLYIR
ncbi:MAG: hypothetical protein J6C06_01155 [Lachnospiraceae bacterium]|nr:hypothetical protein [Lachnospiraceae bacterium]